jgi:hypothetical protein
MPMPFSIRTMELSMVLKANMYTRVEINTFCADEIKQKERMNNNCMLN